MPVLRIPGDNGMTTPTPASPPELCPDCGRPKCRKRDVQPRKSEERLECYEQTIYRQRSALAALQAKLDALVAESRPEHDDAQIHSAWSEQYPNTEKERRHDASALDLTASAEDMFVAFEHGWIACWLESRKKAGL